MYIYIYIILILYTYIAAFMEVSSLMGTQILKSLADLPGRSTPSKAEIDKILGSGETPRGWKIGIPAYTGEWIHGEFNQQ